MILAEFIKPITDSWQYMRIESYTWILWMALQAMYARANKVKKGLAI